MSSAHQTHAINTRGGHPLWQLYMLERGRWPTYNIYYLDTRYGMGDRRTVPCMLDYSKTLPWIATAQIIERIDHPRLPYGVSENTHVLLCIVSLWFECHYYLLFPLKLACTRFVVVSSLGLVPAIVVCQPEPSTSVHFSSLTIQEFNYTGSVIYNLIAQISQVVQMFVLGPRLILGVREYHAKLVASSDAASGMTSIAFQERIHISTNIDV